MCTPHIVTVPLAARGPAHNRECNLLPLKFGRPSFRHCFEEKEQVKMSIFPSYFRKINYSTANARKISDYFNSKFVSYYINTVEKLRSVEGDVSISL